VVYACDSSQVEARRMAAHAGQEDLVQGFREGRDVYCDFGETLYNRIITKADSQERAISKEGILSVQYGSWYQSFRSRLWTAYGIIVSEEFAKDAVLTYRYQMDGIVWFWKECEQAIDTMLSGGQYWFGAEKDYLAEKGRITLPDGWIMVYEDLKVEGEDDFGRPLITYIDRVKRSRRRIHKGIIANNCTQGSSARLLQWQFKKIRDEGFPIAGTVHDEGVWCVHRSDLPDLHDITTHYMRRTPSWCKGTPIDCEASVGYNYGDQTEIKNDSEIDQWT